MRSSDLGQVLELNNAVVPNVNELDLERLRELVDMCSGTFVARSEGVVVGFAMVMAPGADYDSPNYRYFEDRFDEFRYLDRIAVSPHARRHGVGRALYEAVFDHARSTGVSRVTCEVNVSPPNPASMAFHLSLGFVELEQQATHGETVVQLLVAER